MDKLGKVFMLDDDKLLLEMYKTLLEGRGFEVFTTDNAYKFLLYAKEIRPDLFIVDINMPEMSGWEVVLQLKQTQQLRNIPIVILTVRHDINLATTYGVANFLNKPLEVEKLLDVAEAYCLGAKKHDILLLGNFENQADAIKAEINRHGWSWFEVYDLGAAECYLQKNSPQVVCLELEGDDYAKARQTLNHPLILPLKNMQDVEILERFIK